MQGETFAIGNIVRVKRASGKLSDQCYKVEKLGPQFECWISQWPCDGEPALERFDTSLLAHDPRLTHYIANGNAMSWGRAKTKAAAIRHMRSFQAAETTEYIIYRCTPETEVDGLGCIAWPCDTPPPVKIDHVRKAKP